jgi:predicted RNA binding protein YcfA (HicA-like mRNA interferase family)
MSKGAHVIFRKESRTVVVPHHRGDLQTGTLRAIYRDAGRRWPPQG